MASGVIRGIFNDALTALPAATPGEIRATPDRALHVNLRNNAGTELGTISNPLVTTNAGSTVGFSSGTPSDIAVTSTSSVIVPANANRKFLRISNYSTTPVWIQYNAAAGVGQGIRLLSGSVFEITGIELWLGSVSAITSSGSTTVNVFEGS